MSPRHGTTNPPSSMDTTNVPAPAQTAAEPVPAQTIAEPVPAQIDPDVEMEESASASPNPDVEMGGTDENPVPAPVNGPKVPAGGPETGESAPIPADVEDDDAEQQETKDAKPVIDKVLIPTGKLTPALRQQIYDMTAGTELYPDHIQLTTNGQVVATLLTKDIYDLKGHDDCVDRPKFMSKRAKLDCVIAFRRSAKNPQDGEAQTPGVFIGPSIDVQPTEAPQDAGNRGRARGRGGRGGRGGIQQDSTPKIVRPLDVVRFSMHCDSQTPNIEITTRKDGTSAQGSTALVSLRLFASDIAIHNTKMAAMVMSPGDQDLQLAELAAVDGEPSNASLDELAELASANRLVEISILLQRRKNKSDKKKDEEDKLHRREWTGLSRAELNAIRKLKTVDPTSPTFTRDSLIRNFDQGRLISVFMRCSKNSIEQVYKFFDYMRRVTTLAKVGGNFNFYRVVTKEAGLGLDVIDEPGLPECHFPVFRPLVKAWQFTRIVQAGKKTFSRPRPYHWGHHQQFTGYPNARESAFLLKLGIEGERIRQTRNLNEIAQSKDNVYFRAKFTELVDRPGEFVTQIYLSDDASSSERSLKMPAIGTKIVVLIDATNPFQAHKNNATKLVGSVTADVFDKGANFVCMLRGPSTIFKKLDLDEAYPVSVAYTNDKVPFERQVKAVEQLAAIDPANKPEGLDVLALFFNECTPAPMPNAFKQVVLQDKRHDTYTHFVDMQPDETRPNTRQKQAIMDVINSESGLTVIQGPPGTGKTNTSNVIVLGLSLLPGINVMVTAPQNEAVLTNHEAFAKSTEELGQLKSLQFVHFTGAFVKVKAAERLEVEQSLRADHPTLDSDDIDFMINADNLLVQFARMSLSSDTTPDANWTFGRKLKQQATIWSVMTVDDGDKTAAQVQLASQQYFQLLEALPTIHDRTERRQVLHDIEVLEYNLGYMYLKHVVRVVFCTLSTSAHPLLVEAFDFQELMIDEAAHESLGGLATAFGAHKHKIKHVTLSGDHKQGAGVYAASDSNVGHGMLSRNLFQEIVEGPRSIHNVFQLNESYRMLPELLEFHQQFYTDLAAHDSSETIEKELQVTVKAFWTAHLRSNFAGSKAQVCIDVTGDGFIHEKQKGTTTKQNNAEAKVIAWTVKAMLEFAPPENGRKIRPKDIAVVTPYTGQVLEIRKEIRKLEVDPSLLFIASTNHAQGKQRPLVFFSIVVNTGALRPAIGDSIPIAFVGKDNNINVSLSRQRVGRYIVGGLQCLVQMATDGHKDATRNWALFGLLKKLAEQDCIVSADEWAFTMANKGQKPASPAQPFAVAKYFSRLIKTPFGANTGPGDKAEPRNRPIMMGSGLNPFDFASRSSVTNTNVRPEPAQTKFSGLDQADAEKKQDGNKGPGGKGKGKGKGPNTSTG